MPEFDNLPTVGTDIPRYTAPSSPFRRASTGAPPRLSEIQRRDRPNTSPRQRWFEEVLRSLAAASGSVRIPWRFRTPNGDVWQLDRGAVGHAMANGIVKVPSDPNHVLEFIEFWESGIDVSATDTGAASERVAPTAVFKRLTSPAAVKAAIAECDQHGRDRFLSFYGFKPSRTFELHYDGKIYASKAIAAVAFGYQNGIDPLRPEQCSAGRHPGHAGWALDRLGFRITGINHVGWWLDEVEPTVDAYFDMMVRAAAGEAFKKSDYLERLHEANPARTLKAFEFKLQNISAVFRDLGGPWLEGYAPKSRSKRCSGMSSRIASVVLLNRASRLAWLDRAG